MREPESAPPAYTPPSFQAVWLSSAEVADMIARVVGRIGSDEAKAAGFDLLLALDKMAAEKRRQPASMVK